MAHILLFPSGEILDVEFHLASKYSKIWDKNYAMFIGKDEDRDKLLGRHRLEWMKFDNPILLREGDMMKLIFRDTKGELETYWKVEKVLITSNATLVLINMNLKSGNFVESGDVPLNIDFVDFRNLPEDKYVLRPKSKQILQPPNDEVDDDKFLRVISKEDIKIGNILKIVGSRSGSLHGHYFKVKDKERAGLTLLNVSKTDNGWKERDRKRSFRVGFNLLFNNKVYLLKGFVNNLTKIKDEPNREYIIEASNDLDTALKIVKWLYRYYYVKQRPDNMVTQVYEKFDELTKNMSKYDDIKELINFILDNVEQKETMINHKLKLLNIIKKNQEDHFGRYIRVYTNDF